MLISETFRIIALCIPPLHALHWISFQSKPPPCHVSDSSQQQRKLQTIGILILGQMNLKNCKLWSLHGVTIPDLAEWNSNEVEEINIAEYQALLSDDNWQTDFDKDITE